MKLEYGFKQGYPAFECLWHRIAVEDDFKEYKTFSEDSKCLVCTGFNRDCRAYTPIIKVLDVDESLENSLNLED